jgi:methionyl-tRNA formyltransferase
MTRIFKPTPQTYAGQLYRDELWHYNETMRIVFFGTPDFAVPSLQELIDRGDVEIAGVVTQPDARRGRGNTISPCPVKALALQYDLPVWHPHKLRREPDFWQVLADTQADFFVVVAYGQILPQAVLDIPRSGCINVHGSLLPKYRGAAPIQWALVAGETTTGVTTMLMDAGIDTGDMLLKAEIPIDPEDNYATLSPKLAHLGAKLLSQTLDRFPALTPIPQDHDRATYAPLISKSDWEIDWHRPGTEIWGRIRGFYPDCYSFYQGQRLKILQAKPWEGNYQDAPPGTIVAAIKNQGFVVQTGTIPLLIQQVNPAGKKPQTGWEWGQGKVGTTLSKG